MIETVRYTYRLRPGVQAERTLLAEWHRCQFLWNEAVHQQKSGNKPTLTTLETQLTEARARSRWLREGSQVAQDTLGHWHASFVVRRETTPRPEVEGAIGIHWGVKVTATTTNPVHDKPHLGRRTRCAAEVAKAQRKMARRHRTSGPQSKGYQRAKRESAKAQKKAARQNAHDTRQWARTVVEEHQLIAVEDFRPRMLFKSTMARKARDAAIGQAKRMLVEYGVRAGRNAARVILAVAERGHTRVEDVRHESPPFGVVGCAVRA